MRWVSVMADQRRFPVSWRVEKMPGGYKPE
jgi:hypothetical protein